MATDTLEGPQSIEVIKARYFSGENVIVLVSVDGVEQDVRVWAGDESTMGDGEIEWVTFDGPDHIRREILATAATYVKQRDAEDDAGEEVKRLQKEDQARLDLALRAKALGVSRDALLVADKVEALTKAITEISTRLSAWP